MIPERICIFIDGSNLFHSSKQVGIKVDLEKLRDVLVGDRKLIRPYFYSAEDNKNNKQKNFFNKLKYLGFDVKTLPLRRYREDAPFEKGVDVMLVTDMLILAHRDVYDTAILVSGDKDYVYPVKAVKEIGKKIEVASFEYSVARELKLEADKFISLDEIKNIITKI